MASVTQRISKIKQPRGGYLNPNDFEIVKLDDIRSLNGCENIHASLIGLAVDYLTRFMKTKNAEEAFAISRLGAEIVMSEDIFDMFIGKVTGLDDKSITYACKLCGFDAAFRAGIMAYKPVEQINPDAKTIEDIRTMVERSLRFFEKYGPVTHEGFTFEGGYTKTVDAGDGDFLTEDTLWDFKTSVKDPTNKHTLQLLMYYIMGLHSKHAYYKKIKKLGIYNPKLNKVYLYEISNISPDIIKSVEDDVICY